MYVVVVVAAVAPSHTHSRTHTHPYPHTHTHAHARVHTSTHPAHGCFMHRIDAFAVRQWPGHGIPDFRGVLKHCTAAIVASPPIEGTLLEDRGGDKAMNTRAAREAFLTSDEYAEVAKVLPFCRLWCVGANT